MDTKGAYLNGWLGDNDVYMHQPDGFIIKRKEVFFCKLNKSMYGLKQYGRVWHHTLCSKLQKVSFTPGEANTTILFQATTDGLLNIAGWYIDNGHLAAYTTQVMDKMVHDIRGSFKIQDLGEPS